jgi:dTDP-4-dehydrorhamnose reductase
MSTGRKRPRPEIWGGIECTVNRLGDRYLDQIVLTGHESRIEDLDRIASLGVRTLRYPVLWERTCVRPGEYDWRWADARLDRLQQLGIEPIVGLVHHGSGPRWTSLMHESFAAGVGQFAGAVAARYPWVRRYTVINEPLTTARFSGLYGHWFPHATDDRSFVRALLNQCRATALAMAAIRAVRSDAELIQTEDVSRTSGPGDQSLQGDFYNDRAWLSIDLLTGRADRDHPLFAYLTQHGATESELAGLSESPCPRTFSV